MIKTISKIFPLLLFLILLSTSLKGADSVITTSTIVDTIKQIAETKIEEEGNKNPMSIINFWKILATLIIFFVGYMSIKYITKIFDILAEKSANYRITFKGIATFIRIFGWLTIMYIVIQGIFQPPIETLLAFTASAGIALGFAAQDFLKNIFGGIMILLDRPFQVGDKIEVGSHYGEVLKIGLRSTRVVTPDDSIVSIPNGEIMNQPVSNSNSGEPDCQVVAEIFLPYWIDTSRAREIGIKAAQVSPFIYLEKPVTVNFASEMKTEKAVLKMRIKAYVHDIRYEFSFKSSMVEIVLKELFEEGMIDESYYK
ncbi:MAG: mechanosensitive ion channel family protein [Ignavibacteriaceae bacterium]|nr:mechanosensitive ion channel family protein [Ignavibacteriaceae bacterium]